MWFSSFGLWFWCHNYEEYQCMLYQWLAPTHSSDDPSNWGVNKEINIILPRYSKYKLHKVTQVLTNFKMYSVIVTADKSLDVTMRKSIADYYEDRYAKQKAVVPVVLADVKFPVTDGTIEHFTCHNVTFNDSRIKYDDMADGIEIPPQKLKRVNPKTPEISYKVIS